MGLASCLKDERFENGEYQTINSNVLGKEWVSIPVAGKPNKIFDVGVVALPDAQTIELFPVSYDYQQTAGGDFDVTLEVNNNLLTAANDALAAAGKATLTTLPTNAYNFPSLKVKIPAGGLMSAPLPIVLNTNLLDPQESYGIGFTLTSVSKSGVGIPANLKDVVVAISIKNKFDAIYTYYGKYDHPADRDPNWTRTEFKYPYETALLTTGPKTVTFYNDAFGSGFLPLMTPGVSGYGATALDIVFDDNDKVVSVNNPAPDSRNRQFQLIPGGNSRYDASTKTLYLEMTMSQDGFAPTPMHIRMEYLKPRP